MKPSFSAALALSLVVVGAVAASADPVRIVQDQRLAAASVTLGRDTSPSNSDAASDRLTSTATLTSGTSSTTANAIVTSSFAEPLHWFGIGTADGSTATQGIVGASDSLANFGVRFDVREPVAYTFNGRFETSSSFGGPLPAEFGDATWSVLLFQQIPGGSEFFRAQAHTPDVRSFAGTLEPDEYFLLVKAHTNIHTTDGTATAGFNFTFDLAPLNAAPTPEPASLLLLGTAIAVFGVRRQKRTVQP